MLADAVFLLAELAAADGEHRGRDRGPQGLPREAAQGPARLGGARPRAAPHAGRRPGRTRPSARRSSSLPRARAGRSCWASRCARRASAAEARQQFERALAMAPAFTEPLEQLAAMSFAEKNPRRRSRASSARRCSSRGRRRSSTCWAASSQAAGDPQRAEQAYLKAIELNPRPRGAYVALGQIYGASKEYDRAIGELDKALAAEPGPAGRADAVVDRAADGRRPGQGARGLREAGEGEPPLRARREQPRVDDRRGGQGPAAGAAAGAAAPRGGARATRRSPTRSAGCSTSRAPTRGRRRCCGEAAEKLPTNAEVLYHLGMAQAKLGKNAEARASLAEEPGALGHAPRRRRGEGGAGGAAAGEVVVVTPSTFATVTPSTFGRVGVRGVRRGAGGFLGTRPTGVPRELVVIPKDAGSTGPEESAVSAPAGLRTPRRPTRLELLGVTRSLPPATGHSRFPLGMTTPLSRGRASASGRRPRPRAPRRRSARYPG